MCTESERTRFSKPNLHLSDKLHAANIALLTLMALQSAAQADMITYSVVNTKNDGVGSLRDAILAANGHSGLDRVSFNIPSPSPYTINLTSPLPDITDPIIIDGTTQPG